MHHSTDLYALPIQVWVLPSGLFPALWELFLSSRALKSMPSGFVLSPAMPHQRVRCEVSGGRLQKASPPPPPGRAGQGQIWLGTAAGGHFTFQIIPSA